MLVDSEPTAFNVLTHTLLCELKDQLAVLFGVTVFYFVNRTFLSSCEPSAERMQLKNGGRRKFSQRQLDDEPCDFLSHVAQTICFRCPRCSGMKQVVAWESSAHVSYAENTRQCVISAAARLPLA